MKLTRELIIITGLMFGLAWMFIEGWDAQADLDAKKQHEYILSNLATGDSYTRGNGYYQRKQERGR